jgi:hypothetical protein
MRLLAISDKMFDYFTVVTFVSLCSHSEWDLLNASADVHASLVIFIHSTSWSCQDSLNHLIMQNDFSFSFGVWNSVHFIHHFHWWLSMLINKLIMCWRLIDLFAQDISFLILFFSLNSTAMRALLSHFINVTIHWNFTEYLITDSFCHRVWILCSVAHFSSMTPKACWSANL